MLRSYAKIFSLLTRRQRRNFGILILVMFISGILDLAGVMSILPFLAVLADPGIIETRAPLRALYTAFGFDDTDAFLRFLGVVVFAVTVISLGFRALTFYVTTRFTRGVAMQLGIELLRRYLSRPYEWFLTKHTSDLEGSVLEEVRQVVTSSIAPGFRLIANGIVLVLLVGLLFLLEPIGAVMVGGIVGGSFGLIYARLRSHLRRIGKDRKLAVRERFQVASEAMGGIKEVKMFGLEDAFLKRFLSPSERLARHQASVQLFGELPRYVLEGLTFGGMLLFILYLLWSSPGGIVEVLPIIGAFAFAGLKLMPSLQLVFKDASLLRFGESALSSLSRDLDMPVARHDPHAGPSLPLRRSLRLEDVSYRYPGTDASALHGITLEIPAGTSAGFVGPTGAGKTTAIDIILGLLRPETGRIAADGTTIDDDTIRAWQRGIGYVPQAIYLMSGTVASNIAFGETDRNIDDDAVRRAARMANLEQFIGSLPDGYETEIGENGLRLSGGQRQRIGIARALYRNPDIVVFDEATSALDTVSERQVIEALNNLQGTKTVIMITHRLSTVAHCDQVFMLKDGQLAAAGNFDALSRQNEEFRKLIAATK